jgi:hypothetical protein
MQPMESVLLVDAHLVEKMLLPMQVQRPSMPVSALLVPTLAPRHAFLALLALTHQKEQQAYQSACAKKTFMETPQPVMPVLRVLIKVSNRLKQQPGALAKLTFRLVCVLKERGERIP